MVFFYGWERWKYRSFILNTKVCNLSLRIIIDLRLAVS